MTDSEWKILIDETCRFAERAALRLFWATPTGFPEWKQVADEVLAVVDDLHAPEPKNQWDPKKMDLRGFLKMAVWANLRLAATCAENRRRVDLTDGRGEPALNLVPDSKPNPEDTMIGGEKRKRLFALVTRLRNELPVRYLEVFDRWYEGLKPAAIAAELGVSVQTVYPRIRGIRRVAQKSIGADLRHLLGED